MTDTTIGGEIFVVDEPLPRLAYCGDLFAGGPEPDRDTLQAVRDYFAELSRYLVLRMERGDVFEDDDVLGVEQSLIKLRDEVMAFAAAEGVPLQQRKPVDKGAPPFARLLSQLADLASLLDELRDQRWPAP